jgi:hypothetical protein
VGLVVTGEVRFPVVAVQMVIPRGKVLFCVVTASL